MAVNPAPFGPKPQFELSDGTPAIGNQLFFYVAGSVNTKQNTYTDSTGLVANTNPVVLNALGNPATQIWFTAGQSYKVVYAPSNDTDPPTSPIWTIDNLTGINDVAVASTQSEWVAGPTPTYVGTTSFTLVGDQTSTFTKGRRVKTTNSGGTVYSTITNTVFGAVTTVTVANDSGTLDSGLSAVSYGLTSAVNPIISSDMIYRKGTAVAAAATTDIWGIAGDYVHVTGSGVAVTSLGTAPYAGDERTVIFNGSVTLTYNATTLVLPGLANIVTSAGDIARVRADTTANAIVTDFSRTTGFPVVGTSVPRSYLAGLTLSTAGGSGTMSIAAGMAADSTNAVTMSIPAFTKTTSAWAVGTGNGGLDTGAVATGTWYHFYLIMRPDTGVIDVLFSTSASAPTMPANYTYKRRIGSGKTDGSSQWILFSQEGDTFLWAAPVSDYAAANPGTSAVSRALTVPTGVVVLPIHSVLLTQGGTAAATYCLISSLATTDTAPSATLFTLATGTDSAAVQNTASQVNNVTTNTSAQIRTRVSNSAAGTTLSGSTQGWVDHRGRDA